MDKDTKGPTMKNREWDPSIAPTPRGEGVSKRVRYEWQDPSGEPGRFQWEAKGALRVDRRYQRELVSERKVRKIAREWDWVMVGVILVVERGDGSLWVLDGQHRVQAALMRDDISELPCMIYRLDHISDEAFAFYGINMHRSAMASYDQHKAARESGDPVAAWAHDIITKHGYHPGRHSNTPRSVKGILTVHKMVKADRHLADRVFGVAAEVAAGRPMSTQLLRGLFLVAQRAPEVLAPEYSRKLIDAGQDVALAEIRRHKALVGKGGERVEAEAVLAIVNKGRRSRRLSLG